MAATEFRIVQVVQEFSRAGGVETVAFELQRQWDATGVPSSVLAATVGPDVAGAEAAHVRFALPPAVTRRIATRGAWRYLGRTALVPSFTLAASARLRLGRRRGGTAEGAVVLSHGDSFVADVVVLHAINAASLAQKREEGSWRWALNPMHAWVEGRDRVMLRSRRVCRYVAVSRRVAAELARFHGVAADRIAVIPNGVDTERFRPDGPRAGLRARFALPAAAPLLLFAGHEFGRKGLAVAIGALTKPGLETAHLVAVGAGDAAAYASMAEASGVGGRVHFTGPVSDMPPLYREADAFVFPTAYETFSLVCMEAMACGAPVLATRVGGIEDYLVEGVNGHFVERDAVSVGAALAGLSAAPRQRAAMAAAARRTALDYDWREVARRYEALLREVWAERQAEPRRGGRR